MDHWFTSLPKIMLFVFVHVSLAEAIIRICELGLRGIYISIAKRLVSLIIGCIVGMFFWKMGLMCLQTSLATGSFSITTYVLLVKPVKEYYFTILVSILKTAGFTKK